MNCRDAYRAGYDHMTSLASWIDLPAPNSTLSRQFDWQGLGILNDAYKLIDAWEMIVSVADDNARQYVEFAMVASEINACDNSETLWEYWERGSAKALTEVRRKRFPLREVKKLFKECVS